MVVSLFMVDSRREKTDTCKYSIANETQAEAKKNTMIRAFNWKVKFAIEVIARIGAPTKVHTTENSWNATYDAQKIVSKKIASR